MKQHAPAALRNREPIAKVLAMELPDSGVVLEVASGSGEHVMHFAEQLSKLTWQPSDPDESAIASIDAYRSEAGAANVLPPILLDASAPDWPVQRADAIVCINMVHISHWSATEGLFAAAASLLDPGQALILYGPYVEPEVATAPSNIAFDQSLKDRNPAWGLRERTAVDALAVGHGFSRTARYEMPANNLILVYRKRGDGPNP